MSKRARDADETDATRNDRDTLEGNDKQRPDLANQRRPDLANQRRPDLANQQLPDLAAAAATLAHLTRRNADARRKAPDEPATFLSSEIELHAHVVSLHELAATPHRLPALVRTQAIPCLLALLAHENTDVAAAVVELLHELTDADDVDDADQACLRELVRALFAAGAPAALLGHLERLDDADADEAASAYSTLAIFESLLDSNPGGAAAELADCGLLAWLLKRLAPRDFHANKLYASELLAILLQESAPARALLCSLGGVLALLTAASQYRRREPAGMEEGELIENVFDALLSALGHEPNLLAFLEAEGVELMLLVVKEQRFASRGALKVLAASLGAHAASCERLVDALGFKVVFPLLGRPPPPPPPFARGAGERAAAKAAHDEHCACIVVALLANLDGQRRQRLLGKFVEADFEKLERLLDVRAAYARIVDDAGVEAGGRGGGPAGAEDDPDERAYLARLEAGLVTLQGLDVSLSHLATAGHKGLRRRVLDGLYARGGSLLDVWAVAEEVVSSVDECTLSERQRQIRANLVTRVEALIQRYSRAVPEIATGERAIVDGPSHSEPPDVGA